jgi:hypothetical protein
MKWDLIVAARLTERKRDFQGCAAVRPMSGRRG